MPIRVWTRRGKAPTWPRGATGPSPPQLEVSGAPAALTLPEKNQVQALYTYNQSRVLLDRAVGRYAYGGNGPGSPAAPPDRVVGVPAAKGQPLNK